MSVKDISYIKDMPEAEAKRLLAELMFNYHKIGIGDYSKEKCLIDYQNIYRKMTTWDMFTK